VIKNPQNFGPFGGDQIVVRRKLTFLTTPISAQFLRILMSTTRVKTKLRTPIEIVIVGTCWKYALEPTGFDPLVDSDGFDPLWCKSPNGPQML
jgi:hypothetical protein